MLIDDDFNLTFDLAIDEFEVEGDPNHYCIEDKTEVSLPLRVTLSLLGRKRTEDLWILGKHTTWAILIERRKMYTAEHSN